jgi:hypothetical protein
MVLWTMVAGLALAGDDAADVSFSEDIEVRYWDVPDVVPATDDPGNTLDYVEQVARLTGTLSYKRFDLFLQVDEVALFANRYELDGALVSERALTRDGLWDPYPGDYYANLEKVRGRLSFEHATIELGDSYVAFGRGIALNLNRNVDIDIDTSVQGAKALLRPGAWDITLVAGQANRQQVFQDNPNLSLDGDRRHTVAGVRAERFGLGPANLGAHGVMWQFVSDAGILPGFERMGAAPDVVVGGATAELTSVLGLDWFAEGDVFAYPKDGQLGADKPGYAGYVSTAAYLGPTTWLLEGKRYKGAEFVNAMLGTELYEVAAPPSLEYERVITEDSSAALNSNDIYAARLRVDIAAVPGKVLPYVSLGVQRDLDTGVLHFNDVPETILHPIVGLELMHERFSVLANGGYRVDRRDGAAFGYDSQAHSDIDVKVPLFGDFHADVNAAIERYHWGVNQFQQADYTEMETATSFQKGSLFALIWYMDYTTNPLVDSTGNLSDAWYGAGELQIKPTPAMTVKAFYGAYKAGIRCSGGQCRLLPGFEGARVSVAGNF